MPELDPRTVALATIVAFAASGAYYAVLGSRLATVSAAAAADQPTPWWTFAVELIRTLVIVVVVAAVVEMSGIETWIGAAVLGAGLWFGIPAMLWVGAILHEKTPLTLAAIHAGDWLIKLVVVAVIVA